MKMIGIMEEIKMGETAKKAILAVSFGTSHSDTRKVTIDAIEEELKAAFEDYSLYRAWTSKMILARLENARELVTFYEPALQPPRSNRWKNKLMTFSLLY